MLKVSKMSKVISILMIVMTIVSCASMVMANSTGLSPKDLDGSGEGIIGTEDIKTIGNSIISVIRAVGIVLAVIILAVLGIKYMMGSAEEKAEYKKTMIPYIVGAVLLFAASAFAEVVYNFATGIGDSI